MTFSKIPDINILHKEKNNKEKAKNDTYNLVLNKCIEKIIFTNQYTDKTFIYFEIPYFLIGFQSYDRLACIKFLIEKLSEKHYKVEFIEPCYLWIDWGTNIKTVHHSSDTQFIQKLIPTSNPEKLEYQTKQLLKKYPNTSKIIFEYEDQQVKNKKKK